MRNIKIKTIGTLFALALLMLVNGCRSDSFKLNAEIKGLGSQRVRVVYFDASGGLVDQWVTAEKDFVAIEGTCTDPSLLLMFNTMNVPMLKTVVSGGDKLEVTGTMTELGKLVIKGSEDAEKWCEFVAEHEMEYRMNNNPALNAAIEKYVKSHPKSLVSTLLVLVDYAPNDAAQTDRLLALIDDSAKPSHLMSTYNMLEGHGPQPSVVPRSMNLMEMESQDFQMVSLADSLPSVVVFWDKSVTDQEHTAAIEELKMLDPATVHVFDVNVDSDSVGWHKTIAKDSTSWKHYWAPGSVMNSDLLRLKLNTLPTIIVTNKIGKQLYRGNDASHARQTVENQ